MKEIISVKGIRETYKSEWYANQAISRYNHILPVRSSIALSSIIGYLATDGFLDIKELPNSKRYAYVGFFSKYKHELASFDKLIFSVFGIRGKIMNWGVRKFGTSYGYIITNSFAIRSLAIAGVPYGNKVLKEYEIPDWILNGSRKIKKAFLQASFDAEGSIYYHKNKQRWVIKYSMWKVSKHQENCKDYLNQLKVMLLQFGIKTSNIFNVGSHMRSDGTKSVGFEFRIYTDENIKKYHKMIGFTSRKKKKRSQTAIKELKILKRKRRPHKVAPLTPPTRN